MKRVFVIIMLLALAAAGLYAFDLYSVTYSMEKEITRRLSTSTRPPVRQLENFERFVWDVMRPYGLDPVLNEIDVSYTLDRLGNSKRDDRMANYFLRYDITFTQRIELPEAIPVTTEFTLPRHASGEANVQLPRGYRVRGRAGSGPKVTYDEHGDWRSDVRDDPRGGWRGPTR